VAADATDPVAASSALSSLGMIVQTALAHDLYTGDPVSAPFEIRAHARYNPAASSRLNIVPGLVGTILTMTMLIFTALSVGALAGITMWIMPLITDRRGKLRLPIDASPSDQSVLIMSALLVLLCGVVIRAVYAHQRFWVASLILLLPSSVLLSIDWSIGSLLARLNRVSTTSMHIDVPDRLEMVRRYESFVVLACIATLGLLVGIVLNRYIARGASKRIVRRRRKLRARQARQD